MHALRIRKSSSWTIFWLQAVITENKTISLHHAYEFNAQIEAHDNIPQKADELTGVRKYIIIC